MPVVDLTGDAAQANAAEAITEALADAMVRRGRGRIAVIEPSTASKFKGSPVDVRRIGAELNVHYVLQGSLRMDMSRPVLTMRLADAPTAVQLWTQDFASEAGAMPAPGSDVIGRVAATVGLELNRADARRSGRPGAIRAVELDRAA
jgi:adenylate cyclase